jgi:hypothetical protein
MKKIIMDDYKSNLYFSEDEDWSTENGNTIMVWQNTIVPEEEYDEFNNFIKEEFEGNSIPIGSFNGPNDSINFVFTIDNVSKISTKRFNLEGLRWWYDVFSTVNGGLEVNDTNFIGIINKLGLKINE